MGRCEPRIEFIVKMQNESRVFGGIRAEVLGGRLGCEPRIKVILKMQRSRRVEGCMFTKN